MFESMRGVHARWFATECSGAVEAQGLKTKRQDLALVSAAMCPMGRGLKARHAPHALDRRTTHPKPGGQ